MNNSLQNVYLQHYCELFIFNAFDGYTSRDLRFGSDLKRGNKLPQVSAAHFSGGGGDH